MSEGESLAEAAGDKKPKKKFIKSTVTVHDRTQIEAVFDYFMLGAKATENLKSLHYRVEAFFFFPPQLGLTEATYPKERFYADVRPMIRFREPRLGFKRMRGLKPGSDSPLVFLNAHFAAVKDLAPAASDHSGVDEVRVFACSLVGNFLKNIDRWRRRFGKLGAMAAPPPAMIEDHFTKMTRLMLKMHDTLVEYREVMARFETLPREAEPALRTELRLIDEYCYYRLRDGLSFLLLIANGFRAQEHLPAVAEFNAKLKELLDFHDTHAENACYILIRPDSSEAIKEHYLRRRGELKRRVWGVLFLDLRTERLFAFRQQIGPMIAAGLAAVWAGVTQITILSKALESDRTLNIVGLSGILFILVAVVAYIVKDRIKEIGRSYFRKGIFRRIPDHSERIYYEPRRGESRAVGELTEMAKFTPIARLPEEITRIRAAHELFETPIQEDDDTVLHYTKDVRITKTIKILGRYPLRAVHDILRFNVDSFLPRLGEPMRAMNVIDEDLRVHAVGFPKVYFVDLALRHSRVTDAEEDREVAITYFRLVIDKTGLLRVERLT